MPLSFSRGALRTASRSGPVACLASWPTGVTQPGGEVTDPVRGTGDQRISVLGRGAFRIVDGDQGLWVVTNSGAPRQGARVDVTGRIQDGFDFSGLGIKLPGPVQNGLVLVESSRSSR